jgi:serine/threonine protein phosphatase PrpC
MHLDYALITKIGSRDNNEDSVAAKVTYARGLFVVADGLGGHGKGEVASAIATETFMALFEDYSGDMGGFLAKALDSAQLNILHEQNIQKAQQDMKTTCAALLLTDDIFRIAHVGDTRVYVFLKNKVKARTLDHSVSEMLALSGDIKEKNIRNHPDRNRLLRTMGVNWDSPQYDIMEDMPNTKNHAFLLCTDGFWELCIEKKMCAFLKKSKTASEWLSMMAAEVEQNGIGKDMDNYTAIAVLQ